MSVARSHLSPSRILPCLSVFRDGLSREFVGHASCEGNRLTSTSKLTCSPSRNITVQMRPCLTGGDGWGRTIEGDLSWTGVLSSVNWVAADGFVWRRLKKRMSRDVAMNHLPGPLNEPTSFIDTDKNNNNLEMKRNERIHDAIAGVRWTKFNIAA